MKRTLLGMILLCPVLSFGESSVSSETVKGSVVLLEECIKIGTANYEPLRLADEEVELARLKREEAYRAYYPMVSMKAEETAGKTDDVTQVPSFKERLYGATLSHSLYEGGKIHSTYKQAVAAYAAAEKSREKTWQDFVYGVTEAFWKLAAAQNNLAERTSVRDSIKNDLKVMTEQYVLDLAVKQQFLSVKAQYLQANSQSNAAHVAYSKARWGLAKALGLAKPPEFDVAREISFQKREVQLEECMTLAAGHRPDLRMQDYLVELAEQGRTIAGSARMPKLNVNAFYGRSASAYDIDPLHYRDDWQVSARVSQSFWGNSLGLTGSKINTSPKIGQSSRTNTETKGVNLGILDGMKDRTEIKQADLNVRQAMVKRNDLRKDVAIDVEDAYYGFQQALLQVEFTEEDVKLAEEELKVAESKGKYGLTSALELAQARNRSAASHAARMDSLSAYQISLAALNHAVGIVDKFKIN